MQNENRTLSCLCCRPDDDAPAKTIALSSVLIMKRMHLMPTAEPLVPDYNVVHVNSAQKYVVTLSFFGQLSKERTLSASH